MSRKTFDPSSPEEWQEAVDMAKGALLLDSARQYGLVDGGPEVNVERCCFILQEGKVRGYKPAPDAGERFVVALNATR